MKKAAATLALALLFIAGCGGSKIETEAPAQAPDTEAVLNLLEERLENAVSFAARATGKFSSPQLSGDITVNLYFDSPEVAGIEISSLVGAMAVIGSDEERLWQRSYQGDNQTCYIYPRRFLSACSRRGSLYLPQPELLMGFVSPDTIRESLLIFQNNEWFYEHKDIYGTTKYRFDPLTSQIKNISTDAGLSISLTNYEEIAPGFAVAKNMEVVSSAGSFKLHAGKLKAFNFTDAMKEKFFSPPESPAYLTLTEDCRFE